MNNLEKFLHSLQIPFKNFELYKQAFTHPSFSNENRSEKNYQRLEFLGDSILDKLVSEKIFKMYKKIPEGKMTIIRANSVNGTQLAHFALDLGLDKYIRFGKNSENLSKNPKILEDVFEALIGAIFLDLGEKNVEDFLEDNVFFFIEKSQDRNDKNPKTILQEYLQAESREIIEYIVKEISGGFEAKVLHDKNVFGIGQGKTKKEAEVNAATNALKLLGKGK